MEKYERYRAEILPKKKIIRVIRETFDCKNPKHKKKNRTFEVVKIVSIDIAIPIEEFEYTREHFDSTAFQSGDRDFTTTHKAKRFSVSICKELCENALIGYNQQPVLITP